MFRIGQKVVCIKDYPFLFRAIWPDVTLPTKGSIYTIRDIFNDAETYNVDYVYLAEIHNPDVLWRCCRREAGWITEYFRPITDISDLVKLTKVRELEDA